MTDWKRTFGETGLLVSALGFGAGQIGDANLDEHEVGYLLNSVLDLGITLIDTARSYGLSEQRIGQHLAQRRPEFVLSTKVGYSVPGYEDWTASCITAGIDLARRTLHTDYLDIVHLHSCPREVLERGEVVAALESAVLAGAVRVAAYSGDNEPLDWAVDSGHFGSIETSINLCDQRGLDGAVARAASRKLGVIAKRPVANAPWRFAERPLGNYAEVYWERWKTMNIDPAGLDWQEIALRWVAFLPGVHCAIVGSRNLDHIRHNVELAQRGPLPESLQQTIREAFRRHDQDWIGQV